MLALFRGPKWAATGDTCPAPESNAACRITGGGRRARAARTGRAARRLWLDGEPRPGGTSELLRDSPRIGAAKAQLSLQAAAAEPEASHRPM
jgi:hypothetical protein